VGLHYNTLGFYRYQLSLNLPQGTDKLYHIEITLVVLPIDNSQATVDEK
jgi:hypothetical protein